MSELRWAVEEAVRVPKKGEDEALKEWTVPEETIARGPLAAKVWVASVRVFKVVMPEPLAAPMQVPPGKQTFPVPKIWMPPEKVEVAAPVTAKAVRERINPAASIAPEVVVDWLTPNPPVKKPLPVMERA